MSELTAERLREVLHYDPATGVFTRRRTGKVTGCPDSKGYLKIGVDYTVYRAHRLAVLYTTGAWPPDQVDHDNRIKNDNRWSNLKLASHSENIANRGAQTRNATGLRGVTPHKRKYRARIRGKYLGLYATPEEAADAYREAAGSASGANRVPKTGV